MHVQGQLICENLDVAAEAGPDAKFLLRELQDVAVSKDLVIDVIEKNKNPTTAQMSILSGLNVAKR